MGMESENKSYRHRLIVLTAVVLTVLAFGGYFFKSTRPDHKPAGPPEKVIIAYSATTDSVLAQVAQKQGHFLQEGLEVTPHLHPYGKLAIQEVLDGKADFATVAETPIMFAIMKGEKISVIATIQTSNKVNGIIARKDRGILTVNELKGRKIGATLGTTSEFFMDALLAVHGIEREDLEVIDQNAKELQDALVNGDVDAISVFTPYLNRAQKKLGDRGITFYGKDIYTSSFNVVANEEFILANPGKVKKMLRALLKAEEFVRRNPAEAQKSVADFSKVDIDLVREIWGGTDFSVKLEQSLVLALEDETQWAMRNKLTPKTEVPNYLNYIYFDGLDSVRPEAVRILR